MGRICFLLVIAACTLTACGAKKEVSFQSGGMRHTFAEGESAVPLGFPVPIYPGAAAAGSVSAEAEKSSEEAQFLMLSSLDPLEKVRRFYEEELARAGWKVEVAESLPGMISIGASREDLDANVTLSAEGKKTSINIGLSKNVPNEPEAAPAGEHDSAGDLTPATD